MTKELRPYQQEALATLRQRLKDTTHPLLVNASVGAGKSLIIASLLQIIERANWRALCLTMNSTLIGQNAQTYRDQGGTCGIYCTGLGEKDHTSNIIFASPNSIIQGIKNDKNIKEVRFNLIIVDEAHNINPHDRKSMYMQILNHYGLLAQTERYSYRIVGLTGTPYRGKSISIVGEKQLFKEQVCNITAGWLIEHDYLVPPVFGAHHVDSIDMSTVRVDNTGKFKHNDLQQAVDKDKRLTGFIMDEIVSIVEAGRKGVFIFASTVKHVHECMKYLPPEQSAYITAETPHEERKEILSKAKMGIIKYLVNVQTLLVGVDVPNFDTCAWLRPTESLTLFVQGIGRVLRLCEGKKDALVLDYADNVDRHGDIDDPLILQALAPKEKDDPDYCIPCYKCRTDNKITARRCIGTIEINQNNDKIIIPETLLNEISHWQQNFIKILALNPQGLLSSELKEKASIYNLAIIATDKFKMLLALNNLKINVTRKQEQWHYELQPILNNKETRCDYYFIFKPCDSCGVDNDITARHCRACEHELIDPNKKLKIPEGATEIAVKQAQYWIGRHIPTNTPIINARYLTSKGDIFECFFTSSDKAKNIFYYKFMKEHFTNASDYYPSLSNFDIISALIQSDDIRTPHTLYVKEDVKNRVKITNKVF